MINTLMCPTAQLPQHFGFAQLLPQPGIVPQEGPEEQPQHRKTPCGFPGVQHR